MIVSGRHYSNVVAGFTKLFSSLIFSTVWREEMHVKVVWITMLAMANRNGEVLASVPGLADAARVSLEQCQEALRKLSAPDEWSRTKEHEGRRIEEVDGGWRLLNYIKYREIRDADERRLQTRENVRRYRERKASSVTVSEVSQSKPKQKQRQKQTTTTTGAPRVEWVASLGKHWEGQYGGIAPFGRIGRTLKPLRETHGDAILLAHWLNYLHDTPGKYASPDRFAETFGNWSAPGGNGHISEDEAATAFRLAGLDLSQTKVREGGYENRAALDKAILVRKQAVGLLPGAGD